MTAENRVDLVETALWPVVVLVLVLALRRQIGELLLTVAGRISRVSVLSVAIDLAVATEAAPPWRGSEGGDVRGLVPASMVDDSYFDTLRQALAVRSGRLLRRRPRGQIEADQVRSSSSSHWFMDWAL